MNIYKAKTKEYHLAHQRVAYRFGSASIFTCECGSSAREWAHIHNTCMDNTENYKPMCVPCHRKYDGYIGNGNSASSLTEEDVLKIRAMKEEGALQEDLAAIFGVSKSTISSIVNRKTWTHV